MIKINLLAEGRPRVSKPRKDAPSLAGEPAHLWLLILMAVGLLVIAYQYFSLSGTISDKREEIATIQREVDELKPIIAEVEEFERRKGKDTAFAIPSPARRESGNWVLEPLPTIKSRVNRKQASAA